MTPNDSGQLGARTLAAIGGGTGEPAAPQTPEPSFFQKLIPTAGGILGGLAGGLIDPLGGEIIGAGIGGSLGKAVENMTEGKDTTPGDLLASGAENAIGQGIGMGAGSLLGKLAGAAAKPAGNLASGLVKGQFAKGTIDQSVADALRTMGVTDAREIPQIAPIVTQSNGALSTGLRTALENSDAAVNTTGLDNFARQAIANEVGLKDAYKTDIMNTLRDTFRKMVNPEDVTTLAGSGGKGATDVFSIGSLSNVLPENAFTAVQDLEKAAAEAYQKGFDRLGNPINGDAVSAGKIFNKLADELESRTFGHGADALPLNDVAKSAIIDKLSPLQQINPQFYKNLVDQVQNTNTIQELRPLQSNIVQASKAYDATQQIANRGGGTTVADLAGTLGRGSSPIATVLAAGTPHGLPALASGMLLSSPAADRMGASALDNLSGLLSNESLQNLAKKAGGAAGVTVANAPNYVSPVNESVLNNLKTEGKPGESVMTPQSQSLATGSPISNVGTAAQLDAMLAADPYLASSLAPVLGALVPQAQKTNAAQEALDAYQRTLAAAGGGQGPFGGLLSQLGGAVTGGPASQVGPQSAIVQELLKQAGIPGANLPGLFANPTSVGLGLGQQQAILSALQ